MKPTLPRAESGGMLEANLTRTAPHQFRLSDEATLDDGIIQAWFTFETAVAHGEGIFRLRTGQCCTLLTVMRDLKGFEDKIGSTRPQGLRHHADPARITWSETREREQYNWL